MCLRHCFEEGFCTRVKEGEFQLSKDGLRLYHLSSGKKERRSYFKGDVSWSRNSDGSFTIIEHHNIELLALISLLHNQSRGIDNLDLTGVCRKTLGNPHIYSNLVRERVKALIRRGWAKGYGSHYNITSSGVKAAAQALAKRHQF
jgi:hypothetical protein